ncbi:mitochondrial fission ELM1 family protein [Brevundimonas sp.]|uniref:mitochondrial fission ELM1 family protein n=1 Tax=Brevundimonas sp. TaxID=1871086 RepID=UPI0025CC0EDA|nr:mitochondrial fission ELM1 family protein [Brevundimonas sp.]
MAVSAHAPLSIWAVSDGRAGIENQVLGLAEAVARLTPAEVTVKRLAYKPLFDRWPNALRLWPDAMLAENSDRLEPPWPDLMIAAGRASLPFSTRMKRRSGGRTFVVQVQDPRTQLDAFDLVVPPRHDGLEGANVFPITGSPNRIAPERLAQAKAAFASRLEPLPSPRTAVLIGGASKAYVFSRDRADALAAEIAEAVAQAGGSVMVTFSRRTPAEVRAAMTARLGGVPGWIWDGEGENPYFAFLAAADHILVTEDSTNMATEAGATGKPVHVLSLEGGSAKFDALHAELEQRGVSRRFDGRLTTWTYPALNETEAAAREILRRMGR